MEAGRSGEESRRVLVVEDTPEIREILCELLSAEGFDVGTAENGVQALRRLRTETFDLVLLDLMMPLMDGLELLSILEVDHGHRMPPVICMSAFERFRDDVRRLGARAFLVKPVDIDHLLEEIDAAMHPLRGAHGLPS